VIAIVDYFTQDALKPFHSAIFKLLKSIPNDGTHSHNRIASIVKRRIGVWYCFDLTAATDRFPLFIQGAVFSQLFGPRSGSAWTSLIKGRKFLTPDRRSQIEYGVGQPMGMLSSWAVFAITHHAIIRYCFHKVG
jgi:hypothetical protein